jgi:DNA-binding NtrC family response regulator
MKFMALNLSPIYDDLLDFLVAKTTPEEILAFSPSEAAQERAEELLEKNNAGTLTSDEYAELQQMLQVDRLVSVLKARAIEALSHK